MRTQLEARLSTLREEYEAGQKMLAELEAKRAQLTQTLLRIEGAMQVLQELREQVEQPANNVTPLQEAAR